MEMSYEQFLPEDVEVPTRIEYGFISGLKAPILAYKKGLLENVDPPHTSLQYMLVYCRFLGFSPSEKSSLGYKIYNLIVMLFLGVFLVTNTCDLKEASSDIIAFGEDLVILLGLYLIYFKIIHWRNHLPEIEFIIRQFDKYHKTMAFRKGRVNQEILNCQRIHFLGEITSFYTFYASAIFLTSSICLQPFLSESAFHLPYRTKFPFNLHDPDTHPYIHHFIFIFQSICTHHNLLAILVIDNVAVHVISQLSLNLKILCIRLRELKTHEIDTCLGDIVLLHQAIIRLSDRISGCYNMGYILQMGASTFMICLTAFEALLAKDDPIVALKFIVYMGTAFMQLFYYSLMGNFVYVNSLAVAEAAYEVENWHTVSRSTKRDLLFIIRRAQMPILFRPKPLLPFNFETFTTILSTSYSYFTLLKTMIK